MDFSKQSIYLKPIFHEGKTCPSREPDLIKEMGRAGFIRENEG